jgi:hypothetical protein
MQTEVKSEKVACTCREDRYCPSCFEEVKALRAARSSAESSRLLVATLFDIARDFTPRPQ